MWDQLKESMQNPKMSKSKKLRESPQRMDNRTKWTFSKKAHTNGQQVNKNSL